jgi:pimeloyl-ACP methyl ester carboxylesterase
MDVLVDYLSAPADGYRASCPDTIGHGLSQWSPDPDAEYCLACYVQLATALVDQPGLERFDWVGTSMGGSIGLVAAAGALRGRISRLVLNDNGPDLALQAIERIRSCAGNPSAFATVTELEQYGLRLHAQPAFPASDLDTHHAFMRVGPRLNLFPCFAAAALARREPVEQTLAQAVSHVLQCWVRASVVDSPSVWYAANTGWASCRSRSWRIGREQSSGPNMCIIIVKAFREDYLCQRVRDAAAGTARRISL